MKLQEKLKLYQETLKKDEPTNAFNPPGFHLQLLLLLLP